MKTKSAVYYITLLVFIIVPIALGYYIFVNTALARSVLPNIQLNSSDISFYSEEDLSEKISAQALASVPELIDIEFEGKELSLSTKDINLAVDTYDLVNYGKGNDLFKVIAEGLNLIRGVQVNVNYTFDTNAFISKLGLDSTTNNKSSIVESKFICQNNNYSLSSLDNEGLKTDLINSINSQTRFDFKLDKYLLDTTEKITYLGCLQYYTDYPLISENLIKKLDSNVLKVEDIFNLQLEGESVQWKVKDSQILSDYIDKYKISTDIEAVEGEYEIINNSEIYLYKPYTEGSTINRNESISSIYAWVNSNNLNANPLVYNVVQPSILSYGYPIKDFTQQIGVGNTRIELERDGYDNFVIAYTMFGLDEINKHIVNAGEEFSYIDIIDPQPNGTTKSGRPIAGGICNSTTTLFRAVLEAGLQVTDRSYHAYYVPSYEWGYPLNIVDAAYFTSPTVDFKFKNDSDYPILLKIEYSKDNEYQYNTVKILTSSEFKKRTVELANWKVWDKYSSTNFKGSFDRTVSVDGKVLFQDNFYSHYL